MFSPNESGIDRTFRVLLGIALLALGWGGVVPGAWGVVFQVVGFLPLATGLAGFCPLYEALHLDTRRRPR